jgi:triosephosphate isomerase
MKCSNWDSDCFFWFSVDSVKAIGEKKEERESGSTMQVCAKQLEPLAAILEEKGKTHKFLNSYLKPVGDC